MSMRKQRRGVWKIVAANMLAVILLVSMFSPMCFAETGDIEAKAAAIQQNIANELDSLDVEKNEDDPVVHESKVETAANGLSEEKVDQAKSDLFDVFTDRDLEDLRDWAEANGDCTGVLEAVEKTDEADDAYMESDDTYVESEEPEKPEEPEEPVVPEAKTGDLMISPSLSNTTSAALRNNVQITVSFSSADKAETHSAEVFSQDGIKLKDMIITSGKPFNAGVSHVVVIHNIVGGTRYAVEREQLGGFTRIDKYNTSGWIVADDVTEVIFEEEYYAIGAAEFRIKLENKGNPLPRYQYEYMLCDAFSGELQKTAFNMEDGDIYFGSIVYQNLGEPTSPVLTIEPFGWSEDIDYSEPRDGFAVELIPTDDGCGHLTFEEKFYRLPEAIDTANIEFCSECMGAGFIGNDVCLNCKGRGISKFEFTVDPVEDPYFGEREKDPFELTITAKVENVDKPEDVSWTPVVCLYSVIDGEIYYRDGAQPDENGNVTIGPLYFREDEIGNTEYLVITQSPEYIEGLLLDDAAFGLAVTVSEGDENNVVCDCKYIDASDLFLKCQNCDGNGWTEQDGQQVQLKYLTGSYTGFGFSAPLRLNIKSAEEAIAIVSDGYMEIEYVPIVQDKNGDFVLDPNYCFMWTNYSNLCEKGYEPVFLHVFTVNNDELITMVEMPSEEELKDTDKFTEISDGVFVSNTPETMEYYKQCEQCEGSGIIINNNWKPLKEGTEPVFTNYFFTASMTDDADNIETDALPPVEIDGTDNCAEVPEIEMIVVVPEGVEEVVESEIEAAQELTEEEIALIESALSELEPEELVAAAIAAADASDVTAVAKQIVLSELLSD
jgi:hypothetical protein